MPLKSSLFLPDSQYSCNVGSIFLCNRVAQVLQLLEIHLCQSRADGGEKAVRG